MKKILFLLLFATTLAACNDDKDHKIRYASANEAIENGHLTGTNMIFYGKMTVTALAGGTFTDDVWFEFAGGSDDLVLYMHKTRFASNMPRIEMRLYTLAYAPAGDKKLTFSTPEVIPDTLQKNATGGGSSYQPAEEYLITDLEGSIDGVDCRVSFTCAGVYDVTYEGKLTTGK